jgi:hypothetical protein
MITLIKENFRRMGRTERGERREIERREERGMREENMRRKHGSDRKE